MTGAPGPDPLQVWRSLSDLVQRTTRDVGRLTLERYGLPLKAAHVLLLLLEAGAPVRVTDLADDVYLSTSSASRAADLVVARGLVDRAPATDDGRATTLSLTPEGHRLAATAREEVSDALRAALLEALTERQVAALSGLPTVSGRLRATPLPDVQPG